MDLIFFIEVGGELLCVRRCLSPEVYSLLTLPGLLSEEHSGACVRRNFWQGKIDKTSVNMATS